MWTNWVCDELSGVELPDERYRKNLLCILGNIDENTDLSFSRALGESLRKSAWRLFSSGALDLQSGHRQNMFTRCQNEKVVLAIEDTTDVNYSHHAQKKGMGILGSKDVVGINIHTSMCVTEQGLPLGIAYQKIWSPTDKYQGTHRRDYPIEDKESYKWILALQQINQLWSNESATRVVKVADREADFYELYNHQRQTGVELLIRVREKKRNILHNNQAIKLAGVIDGLSVMGYSKVLVRSSSNTKERIATVGFYATKIELPVPIDRKAKEKNAPFSINLVWVKEYNPPDDVTALEWILMTTLPIYSLEQVSKIVHYYTMRWIIERFHYILKQGMQIEKLQIDTLERLQNALQLYSIVAWHLLWLYKLGQQNLQEKAELCFDQESVEILQTVSKKQIITIADFIFNLAYLAGFKPSKKQPYPGEKTLWIASQRFISIRNGYLAAKVKFYGTG